MKQLLFLSFALLCFLHAKPLSLTTQHWPPYQFLNEEGTLKGSATQIVTCALERMQLKYEIKVLPWKRAQLYVKNKLADGFFSASLNEKRNSFATASISIAKQRWNWYLLKENTLSPTTYFFKNTFDVSARAGSNMLEWLKSHNYKVSVNNKNTKELIYLLLNKRLDAILASEQAMNELFNQLHIRKGDFRIVEHLNKPLHIYFSHQFLKQNTNFLESFNNAATSCLKHN